MSTNDEIRQRIASLVAELSQLYDDKEALDTEIYVIEEKIKTWKDRMYEEDV